MTEAQKVMADVIAEHEYNGAYYDCRESEDDDAQRVECCTCGWEGPGEEGAYNAHLADEIDKALGGLERQWSVRYRDGGVTMRPTLGLPSADTVERARRLFTDREIVIGWVSWSDSKGAE